MNQSLRSAAEIARPRSLRSKPGLRWLLLRLGLAGLVTFSVSQADGQPVSPDEAGMPLFQGFAREDYGGHAQNWDVVQDTKGFLYVANNGGVLQFDGVSWRKIRPGSKVARSLAVGSQGRVFVGGAAEIGYLALGPQDEPRYVSLVDQIPEADRQFSDVWKTHALPTGAVYFQAEERLFRWHEGALDVWKPEIKFRRSMVVNGKFYVIDRQGEFFVLEDDALHLASFGAPFAETRPTGLFPHGPNTLLVATRSHGLRICQTGSTDPDPCESHGSPELNEFLKQVELYSGTLLPEGVLALGTRRGGLVLIDSEGRLLRVFDKSTGLRSDSVWALAPDRDGGLWLGLNDGLNRLEMRSPLSVFDSSLGLPETTFHVARHSNQLHAATSRGVSKLERARNSLPRFVPIPEVQGFCWALISTPEGLLAGCAEGLYNLDPGRRIWEDPHNTVYAMHRSHSDPNKLYLGLRDGVARLAFEAGTWREEGRIPGIWEQIRSIVEDDSGHLWLGTRAEGVLRIEADASLDDSRVRRFGVEEGLPDTWLEVHTVAGQVRVLGSLTLYRFDPKTEGFLPDDSFGPRWIMELTEDSQGNVWIVSGEDSVVARPTPEGGYFLSPTGLRRIPEPRPMEVVAEADGSVWVLSTQRLVRLDTTVELEPDPDYPVWVRRITSADGSVLHDGPHGHSRDHVVWPYENNALRFSFAAPRFDGLEHTEYRTFLEGFDEEWSDWSTETYRDFTNLWEGGHTFRVQARDVYRLVSHEDQFTFRILPPWYRTWWAYGVYTSAFAMLLAASAQLYRRRLHRERINNARLRELDRLKDEFLANTSHELRTPLYGIIGLAETMHDSLTNDRPAEEQNPQFRTQLATMIHSGHRLARLVGDLLDFSSLERGELDLVRQPLVLRTLVAQVYTLVRPLAESKQLALTTAIPEDLPRVDADERRLEQILLNLVGNAIKFTREGEVEVLARAHGGEVSITVRDTGPGIAAEDRERIFRAFEQADGSAARRVGGTGIGLAVSRRLVELHGGELTVESSPGAGSSFTLTLPRAASSAETPSVAFPPDGAETPIPTPSMGVPADAPTQTGLERESPSDAGRRILVVDDEPVNRLILRSQLENAGYEVYEAADGFQALEQLEAADLLLLDVMMPRKSGYEVCRELRRRFSPVDLPVIFVTAKSRPEDLEEGFAAGGNDYLGKPVGMGELLARIRFHLESARTRRSDRFQETPEGAPEVL